MHRMFYSFFSENWAFHQCRPVIKQHIQYVLDHSEELDKTLKVQAQVSEVKNIMLDNIEKVCYSSSCTRAYAVLLLLVDVYWSTWKNIEQGQGSMINVCYPWLMI
jgi:hypothetical protein